MKHFLIRLAVYIPVISFFWWIFVPRVFEPEPYPGPFIAQVFGHLVFYGIIYGFWIAAYELCYRAAQAFRKDKPVPVPDTQPLAPFNQDAYGKLRIEIATPFPPPSDPVQPTRPKQN